MDIAPGPWTDQRFEGIVGNLLRGGVVLAAAVVMIGAVIYLIHHGHEFPHYYVFAREPEDLCTIPGILRHVFTFNGRNIIQFGILILIVTPISRVIFSIFAFALQRDRRYVVFTLIVLTVLLFSLAGGHR